MWQMNWRVSGPLLAAVLIIAAVALLYERNNAAARGQRDFERLGCTACHLAGAGPNLTHIVRRQDPKFIERFIENPPAIYEQRGMRPINEGYTLMPDMHATPDDARDIVAYLESLDGQDKQ